MKTKILEKCIGAVIIIALLLISGAMAKESSLQLEVKNEAEVEVKVKAETERSARDIIEEMDANMRGESSYAEMTMIIERPRYTREVSIRSWALGQEYSMILITAPSRDAGTTFLKRGNEIWNFVPSVDRTIKMPPSMMSQSWMGSDFTNDDLVNESSIVNDYEHSIIEEETYEGREAWVIEMIPHEDAAVVWGKVLVWVCKDDMIQLRVENYDQSDQLAQTMELEEIQEMGGRTIPTLMTMHPVDKDQKTILRYEELRFNIDEDEGFFTQRNMQRIR